MYNITEYDMPKQIGWICPKCGRVMAPFVADCICCNKQQKFCSENSIEDLKLQESKNRRRKILKI